MIHTNILLVDSGILDCFVWNILACGVYYAMLVVCWWVKSGVTQAASDVFTRLLSPQQTLSPPQLRVVTAVPAFSFSC